MYFLNKDPKYIRSLINTRPSNWENTFTTNCYSYALGLDIPEREIGKNAFSVVGTIGSNENELILRNKNIITRLELDLDCLNIIFQDTSIDEKLNDDEWLIAVFSSNISETDFHFARKDIHDYWTHKPGWNKAPNNVDDKNIIMKDINKAYMRYYNLEKCLKLRK